MRPALALTRHPPSLLAEPTSVRQTVGVYCVRAVDGTLVWRYRVAPLDRRAMAYEQLESLWPVHGSVLVRDDQVYAVAGRSIFLDGGLRMLRLNLVTGFYYCWVFA